MRKWLIKKWACSEPDYELERWLRHYYKIPFYVKLEDVVETKCKPTIDGPMREGTCKIAGVEFKWTQLLDYKTQAKLFYNRHYLSESGLKKVICSKT